jgi:hypothetical protein
MQAGQASIWVAFPRLETLKDTTPPIWRQTVQGVFKGL